MTDRDKYAYEEFVRAHEFGGADGWLAEGETVSSASATVTDNSDGSDASASMLSHVAPYGSPQTGVRYRLLAGTFRHVYTLAIRIITSSGQKFEDRYEFKVY